MNDKIKDAELRERESNAKQDPWATFDPDTPPVYGCLTGFDLPCDEYQLAPGLMLSKTYVDTFGATMMAFAPPLKPKAANPTPWAAVRGGFSFESRVQLYVENVLDGFTCTSTAWLVASLFRLRMAAPVRLAVLGNMPFKEMGPRWQAVAALAFESAPHQLGIFRAHHADASVEDLNWVRDVLPKAARLYHEDRFMRAFSVYDEANWSPRKELGTILIWTAIECLFDLGGEQNKTKAICESLSAFVASDAADRDRAYNVIRDLYQKRGRVVHVGKKLENQDFLQSAALARAAFSNVLNWDKLPPLRSEITH